MLLNYIRTGLRAIGRQKLPMLLNAGGMAIAVGCCMVVYSFFDLALRCDTLHPNLERIAVAHRVMDNNGQLEQWCDTPEAFGPALQAETPFVEHTCRFHERAGIVREADGDVFRERISFVDTTFFALFDFPMKWGRAEDFKGHDAMILTEIMSEKYFGNENPVGRRLTVRFVKDDQSYEHSFLIVGVAVNIPMKSSFDFQALLPFEAQRLFGESDLNNWKKTVDVTFVMTRSAADLSRLPDAAARWVAVQRQADPISPVKDFGFLPLNVITTEGANLRHSNFNNASVAVLILLGAIAAAMMLLVCFNYINIAMAAATVRLKEISMRKVMGGTRVQIITQFLAENAVVCFASLVGGVMLAHWVFQPWFNGLIGGEITLDYADPLLWTFFTGLFIISVLGAAAYPAFYISSLQPVAIFKNKIRLGEKNLLRRTLVGLQFVLTFITLFAATVMLIDGPGIRSKPWGYQKDHLLVMALPESGSFDAIKNELLLRSDVEAVAGSGIYFGKGAKAVTVQTDGTDLQVNDLMVGQGYLEALQIPVIAGEGFPASNNEAAPEPVVLVNTAFRKSMGWAGVEGKNLRLGEVLYRIAGEVPDFYYRGFDRKIEPALLRLSAANEIHFLTAKVRPGMDVTVTAAMQSLAKEHFPNVPSQIFYQNSVFEKYMRGLANITSLMIVTASLAILLSACGIFGLSMLRLMRRVRELSIRRVLGANAWHFGRLVSGEFVGLLVMAGILGAVLGFLAMRPVMQMFSADHVLAPALPALLTFIVLLFVTLSACGIHFWRLWRLNPASTLKED